MIFPSLMWNSIENLILVAEKCCYRSVCIHLYRIINAWINFAFAFKQQNISSCYIIHLIKSMETRKIIMNIMHVLAWFISAKYVDLRSMFNLKLSLIEMIVFGNVWPQIMLSQGICFSIICLNEFALNAVHVMS